YVEELERRVDCHIVLLRNLIGEGAADAASDRYVSDFGAGVRDGKTCGAALTVRAQPVACPILQRAHWRDREGVIDVARLIEGADFDLRRLQRQRRLAGEADIGKARRLRRRPARGQSEARTEAKTSKQQLATSHDHRPLPSRRCALNDGA